MPQFNFDLLDGKPKVSFALHGEDAERFVAFMAECHKATEIADEAMFSQMACACFGIPEPGESLIPLDEDGEPVALVDLASTAIVDAVAWLKPRGVVDVIKAPEGEVILVLRQVSFALHGEDAERFVAFMAECHKATEIADEAMFSQMACACFGIPEPGESLIPLDEDGEPVALVDLASTAIVDAVAWLKPRGVVDVIKAPEGEVILVLRLPGNDLVPVT